MDNDIAKQRKAIEMNSDFVTLSLIKGMETAPDARSAHALEYIAYQLGKIRQHLEKGSAG